MQIGLQIPDFTRPEGAATLGPALGQLARTADDHGFDFVGVMDHFFQIAAVGPAEQRHARGVHDARVPGRAHHRARSC